METLEIKKLKAETAYKNADKSGKKLLEDLFGKSNLIPVSIMDRIKNFEDVFEVIDVDPNLKSLLNYYGQNPDMVSCQAYLKMTLIARALNEGWEPDWDNSNQYKYFPYFRNKAGFGLSFDDYAFWATNPTVGSRLCFKSRDVAKYTFETFKELYEDYLLIG